MTQRDVIKKIIGANRSSARVKVGDIASRPIHSVHLDTSLHEAAATMVAANIRRVIVEKDGNPIGIVSDTDLFRTVEEFGWEPEVI
ncbi:MAG: CBS domain-containing protein [Candidatus Competibacteraceae bacterium]